MLRRRTLHDAFEQEGLGRIETIRKKAHVMRFGKLFDRDNPMFPHALLHDDIDPVAQIRLRHRHDDLADDLIVGGNPLEVGDEPLNAVQPEVGSTLQFPVEQRRDRRLPRPHGAVDQDKKRPGVFWLHDGLNTTMLRNKKCMWG